jgi:sugar lactone lactonase YvrE
MLNGYAVHTTVALRDDHEIDVLDDRHSDLGEGPIWDERTGDVVWVDIIGCAVHTHRLADAAQRTLTTPTAVGAVIPRAQPGEGWLVLLEDGPALLAENGSVDALGTFAEAGGRAPTTATRANDAKCDPRGRCWCGTMAWNQSPQQGALYRLDPGARVPTRILDDVTISNGLAWSSDARTMYFIDTTTKCISTFDYDLDSATIANRRTLVEAPEADGWPDGMAIDADDCLWVAFWGGGAVRRYMPDGRLDRVVTFPCAQITSCAFVGPALDQLVVTSASHGLAEPEPLAGSTFVLDPGVTGTATAAFGA